MAKILLLQSDDQLSATISAYLKLKGHRVTVHKDPQAAVLAADDLVPDLVILDLLLAARSGAEFLYEMRSYPDWQSLPVIAIGYLTMQQIEPYMDSFNHLDVSIYLPRQSTSLSRLSQEVDRLLRPVTA